MRIVFMGTPQPAVPALHALRAEHEIVLVVTQPDKPAGRGHRLQASPVKEYALANGIAVAQPEKARDAAFLETLRAARPEAIAVVAFGQILPRAILDLPCENCVHGGCVNLHFSLLPRWRGAAPVQYALWKGDAVTGVSTQWMAEKLDAGDLILQEEVAFGQEENAGDLFEQLTPLGARVLADTMRLVQNGVAPRTPQDESRVTFAPTIKKEDASVQWTQDAAAIARHIRAFHPRPGVMCTFRGEALKLWDARAASSTQAMSEQSAAAPPGSIVEARTRVLVATGGGALELRDVQPAGRARLAAGDWARGARLQPGEVLE